MSQTDKIKELLTSKGTTNIDDIVKETGFKKSSCQAVICSGIKKGLFIKTGVNLFAINPNPIKKEVEANVN